MGSRDLLYAPLRASDIRFEHSAQEGFKMCSSDVQQTRHEEFSFKYGCLVCNLRLFLVMSVYSGLLGTPPFPTCFSSGLHEEVEFTLHNWLPQRDSSICSEVDLRWLMPSYMTRKRLSQEELSKIKSLRS